MTAKHKNQIGMSMIEMVVTLAIISIVSVGLMSLLWVNSWWIFKLSNKTDNVIAAQQFLDRLAKEVRSAQSVEPGSNNSTLIIKVPVFQSDRIGSATYPGLLLSSPDVLTYTVQSVAPTDPSAPAQYQIVRSVQIGSTMPYHPQDGRTNIASPGSVVLTGVIGPDESTGTNPKIFQYVVKGDAPGVTEDSVSQTNTSNVRGILSNVELRRYTGSNTSPDSLGFRTEVYLHNRALERL
jgi:prepilin-type N-terminal cleavage/methylation domain-containing protein